MYEVPHEALSEIITEAGSSILKIYESDFAVEQKADDSPLTQADLAAHEVIVAGLQAIDRSTPILSEESAPPEFSVRSKWSRYWLVDPLDGTKEFVNRNGEFTVNIALIENQQAVWGIVGVPVQDKIYVGDVHAGQAFLYASGSKVAISGRTLDKQANELVVVASRSHGGEQLESYIDALGHHFSGVSRTPVGSSLKLCVLAAGEADCYPRLGLTSEWDIAAAHAVLRAAGGEVYTFERTPLAYNTKESLLNPDFVAVSDASFDWWQILPDHPGARDKDQG